MSQDVRIGTTLDASIQFTFNNAWSLIRIGWLPFALTFAITGFLAWHFWQPLIVAYMDFLGAYAEVATDPAALERLMENFSRDMEDAIEMVGVGNMMLGYLGVLTVGMLGAAIVMTAFVRLMALGENPRGVAYFRLGGREIGVAVTYLLVAFIPAILLVVINMVGSLVFVAPFAGSQGGGAALAVIGLLATMIGGFIVFFWVFARLIIAVPASAIHGGVPLGRAWSATKGVGGRIAWTIILGYLILMVISMIALMILGMLTGMINGALTGMGSQLAPYFTGALWALGYIAVTCLTNAFFIGLFTSAYMQLSEGEAA